MADYPPQNLYRHMYERVRSGQCHACNGQGKHLGDTGGGSYAARLHRCEHCNGTGEPTKEDLRRAELYERRVCVGCGFPMVGDYEPDSRLNPTGWNDCLAHATQRIKWLEGRVRALEASRTE